MALKDLVNGAIKIVTDENGNEKWKAMHSGIKQNPGFERDMLILSAGEYRAYIYDGIQRGSHHLGCTVFHGNPVAPVPEIRREATGKFLHRALWWRWKIVG